MRGDEEGEEPYCREVTCGSGEHDTGPSFCGDRCISSEMPSRPPTEVRAAFLNINQMRVFCVTAFRHLEALLRAEGDRFGGNHANVPVALDHARGAGRMNEAGRTTSRDPPQAALVFRCCPTLSPLRLGRPPPHRPRATSAHRVTAWRRCCNRSRHSGLRR